MAKVHKVYPSFFNGVTEQTAEMALNNQCKEMVNCIPDLVKGLTRRPKVDYVREDATLPADAKVFHTYDRGEDNEEYIFVNTKDTNNPIAVYHKDGTSRTVAYDTDTETDIKTYLTGNNLKALTIQDRTWIVNKDVTVTLDYTDAAPLNANYKRTAYYWLKRGSGDRYNPYNYAVYLNGISYAVNPNKPSNETPDPATGAEDSDWAANNLASKINGQVISLYKTEVESGSFISIFDPNNTFNDFKVTETVYIGKNLVNVSAPIVTGGTGYNIISWSYDSDTGYYSYDIFFLDQTVKTYTIEITCDNVGGFVCEVRGSMLKIYRENGGDFTFSSWDSFGNQASEGWKGSVNKITDLPKDMPFPGCYVEVTGGEGETDTNYYVKWNGSSWEECLDPVAIRGKLDNMPVKCDRQADGSFLISKSDWDLPKVGNADNNNNPSFAPQCDENYNEITAGQKINDLFFYRNRFGIASEDSIVLTETANYTNFYIKTAIQILDTDPIDIGLASNQASKIHFVKPFNESLYVFTKYAQYELRSDAGFTPLTVSVENVSNYPMAINVEPVVLNDSLYFISNTDNRQQLREYIKTDKLTVTGVDLNVATPTYMSKPIISLIVNGVLGYVLCCTADNIIYVYNYKSNGEKRIQSAWSTWSLLENNDFLQDSFEYFNIDSTVIIATKTSDSYLYHKMELDDNTGIKQDNSKSGVLSFTSKVKLPDFYPHQTEIGSPKDKILLKKVIIQGDGMFDAEVYRKDYNVTFTKANNLGLADMDLHVNSKVGNVDITITDSSADDFNITSFVVEGIYSPTSREIK